MTLSYLFLSLTLHLITFSAAEDWCYDIQAKSNAVCKEPSKWNEVSANCAKKKQSPINIVTCNATFNSELKPFKFEGYDKENNFKLRNSGHSAELTLDGGEAIKISGGGLSGTYTATQLHFHWGSKDKHGSEHSLNGEKYPIELHIVHKKTAEKSETSIAVLGFFYEEGSFNEKYNNLIEGFNKIALKDNSTTILKVTLQDLIPKAEHLKVYYRYNGSLTTPLCDEAVIWTVFPATIMLNQSQIDAFYTKLYYNADEEMTENFRPIQNRNGRKIFTSSVDTILPHTRYLLISLFVFYLTSIS